MDKLPAEGVGSKRAIEYDFCQTPSAVINLSAEEVVHNLQMVNFDLRQDVGKSFEPVTLQNLSLREAPKQKKTADDL